MSFFEEEIHREDSERRLDSLVDGELNETERRELLLRLEHDPDGWRRCALAFLEAQCWKAELGQMVARPKKASCPTVLHREPSSRRQTWRQYVATSLTIAASFLIALVVGMGLRGNWSGAALHSPDALVTGTMAEFPLANAGSSPARATEVRALPMQVTADDWEMVTLGGDKSLKGQSQTIRVPAQRRNVLDRDMLDHIPDAISPQMEEVFEQSGHRVVQQREIVPLQLNDGRRLVVPVDHVEIHYVGRPSL
jgi:negative regulator of sigma E activity